MSEATRNTLEDILEWSMAAFIFLLMGSLAVLVFWVTYMGLTRETPEPGPISEECIQKLEYLAGEDGFSVVRCQLDLDKADELRGNVECR